MGKIIRYRIQIIFTIAIIVLLSLSVFSYLRINNLVKASALVNHTTNVKLELENIFSTVADMESGHRGYILAKDIGFLTHFNSLIYSTQLKLNEIKVLTIDNTEQQENFIQLKILVNQRIDQMKDAVLQSRSAELTPATWTKGKITMDVLRNHIDKMMAQEEILLKKRTESLSYETILTPVFTIVLIFCSLGVLFLSYFVITRELKISNLLRGDLEFRKKELLEVNNSLLESNDSLKDSNDSLAKMNKELESFTYISSHDLQEPLRKIQTFISRIIEMEDHLSENGKNYLNRTQESAFRMQNLIRDLLAYSRLKTEIFPIENWDLKSLVEDVKSDLDEEIDEKNVSIEVLGESEIKIIVSQFRQLLTNLISNSIKFSDKEAIRITIENKTVKGSEIPEEDEILKDNFYSKITVSDNGVGFEPQFRDRIFEVFQRLHDKKFEGTGIGLAIVKKIVENHNGFISADGKVSEGATFTIYIPF